MNAEEFAEFWKLQGYKVIKTQNCYWYNTEPFVYMSMPYHRVVSPGRSEIMRIMSTGPAVVMRYPAPASEDATGGLFVCSDKNYSIASLDSKARNRTKRALEICHVEQIAFSDMIDWGHDINVQTLVRQEREPAPDAKSDWIDYCKSAEKIPGFEAWAAFVGNEPAGYLVCALVEDCYHLLRQSSATDLLRCCPNNALTFTVTQQSIQRSEVGYVSTGFKSVEDTGGLNRYKEGMGYVLRPFKDCLVIHPLVQALSSVGGAKVIKRLHDRNPKKDFWRKAVRTMELVNQDLSI